MIEGDQPSLLTRINPQDLKYNPANGMLCAKAMEANLYILASGLGTGFLGAFRLHGAGSKLG